MIIIFGEAAHVHPINSALMNMNPNIGEGQNVRYIPYTTESIVSNCVKIAGSCNMAEDLDQYMREVAHHLSPFCNGSTEEITKAISHLIYIIQLKFKQYQWYDSDGSCPWRFVGFVGLFDIQLGKPDNDSTTTSTGHIS